MKTISVIAPEWLAMKEHRQHRKPNTLRAARTAVDILMDTVGDIDPKKITDAHVDKLLVRLHQNAPASFNARRSHLREFFLYCRQRKYIPADFDPLSDVTGIRYVRRDRDRVPESQFNQLLDVCVHPRDRASVAIGLFTLLRKDEITTLRVKHVSVDTFTLDAEIYKTPQLDEMPMDLLFAEEMRRWLTYYTDKCGGTCECMEQHPLRPLCPEFYLVPSKEPARLIGEGGAQTNRFQMDTGQGPLKPTHQNKQMQRCVQMALAQLGYATNGEGGHTLRRSGARALFDALVDQGYDGALKLVQSMLHHRNSATTEDYLGLREDRHRRNKQIRGKIMFPLMWEQRHGNVTQLRKVEEA